MSDKATWLPNLVGGVSIWKLAVDLNEPKFFDGRLLIPETEGSDSLPINVSWKVAGLVALREARAQHAEAATQAIRDFFACVEKVQAELATPTSGFRKFKDAFTVPSLDADDGGNYFYSPEKKKLFVINWGASPRAIAGQSQLVFGFDDFGKLFEKSGIDREGGAPVAASAPAAAAAVAGAVVAAKDDKKPDEKKDEKKKDDEKKGLLILGRPWWVWLLVLLAVIAIVILALFLLRGCEPVPAGPDGGIESADGSTDAGLDAANDADASDAATDAGDAATDAPSDARDDASDASDDGGKDAGKDAGKKDGGDAGDDDGGSGGPSGGGGPAGSVTVIVVPGGGGSGAPSGGGADSDRTLRYSQPGATSWKVVAGKELLAPGSASDGTGETFEVHLKPGASMNGVKVEWQDAGGKWHL